MPSSLCRVEGSEGLPGGLITPATLAAGSGSELIVTCFWFETFVSCVLSTWAGALNLIREAFLTPACLQEALHMACDYICLINQNPSLFRLLLV